MTGNYFFSKTNYTAPSFIKNENNRLPVTEKYFHTPGNALAIEYINGKGGNWEIVISKPVYRGQDHFKKAKFLSFFVFLDSAKSVNKNLPSVGLIVKDSKIDRKAMFGVASNSWQQVIIPLEMLGDVDGNKPADINGVVFSQNSEDGGTHTFYVDDIELLPENYSQQTAAEPSIETAKGYAKHIDISWKKITDPFIKYIQVYRSDDEKNFKAVGIQLPDINRYSDFTGETGKSYSYRISFVNQNYKETSLSDVVTAQTKAMTDDELLTMVQEACFRYYWEGNETNSGLAKENFPGRRNMIASGASGFGIMALIAGTERKFISREQSVDRFLQITDFLQKAETFHGAYAHFIDGTSGKVEPFFGNRDNGGDLVETSFLMQGLLAARSYFNKASENEKIIRDRITSIWEKVEWDWYKQHPDSKFLYWHWSPDQAWVINHSLIGWNETMVAYLLAIASPTHAVPASFYYSGWANQDSTGQQYRSAWGGTKEGYMYGNGNTYYGIKLDVGVSNGGPLFFTHYSYLGYDPHLINDKYTNYFINNQHIAKINYRYCLKNPNEYKGYGDSCWGLTACDGPFDYAADEPVKEREKGKIGPTGAISSFPYTPEESMKALKNYYNNYGKFLWGEYGFRDAFNLTENWCSEIFMGLNQAPMVVMIENYRTGLLWKLFMSNPEIQIGLKKLDVETKISKKN